MFHLFVFVGVLDDVIYRLQHSVDLAVDGGFFLLQLLLDEPQFVWVTTMDEFPDAEPPPTLNNLPHL